MSVAWALDKWMRETFGEGRALAPGGEENIAHAAGAAMPHTISSILDIARKRWEQALSRPQDLSALFEELRIVHTQVEGVLLPPGSQEVPRGDGTGEWEKARTEPRVQRLIAALQERGIYTDDLIVTRGVTLPSMMRQESYVLIEIPRIRREVLACNQVGEATFVSLRPLGARTYLQKTKEELDELPGIVRIVSLGLADFAADVLTVLLQDVSAEETRKIDVKDMQAVRQAIIERVPTGEEWMKMAYTERCTFNIAGRKLSALATVLGVQTRGHRGESRGFYTVVRHALLGKAIYGEDAPAIREVLAEERRWQELENDPERLKAEIRERCPTGEEWMKMTCDDKHAFRIAGHGLQAVAVALDLKFERSPAGHPLEYALLGQAIYGRGDLAIQEALAEQERQQQCRLEREGWWQELIKNPDQLRAEIQKSCQTGEAWMKMTYTERCTFNIAGRKLAALATAFGMRFGGSKGTTYSSFGYVLLGQAIYGEDDPAIREALAEERYRQERDREHRWHELMNDPERLKAEIRKRYPTAQAWMDMSHGEKRVFEVAGRKLEALAAILGLQIKRSPCRNSLEYALLGREIYGQDDPVIIEALTLAEAHHQNRCTRKHHWSEFAENPERLKVEIRKRYPTAQAWIGISLKEKMAFKIGGLGLAMLAKALGLRLKRNPRNSLIEYVLLGQAIYGEDDPAIQAYLREHQEKSAQNGE